VTAIPDLAARTVETSRRELAMRFTAAGIETPELDARLLVGATLDLDLTAIVAQRDATLTAEDAERLMAFAARRLAGEPVARIVGEKEFWGLRFALSPETLVPRPDTETVVEAALEFVRTSGFREALRIADVGTGSGAILLALLSELPHATGTGTDIAAGALAVAKGNAEQLGFSDRTKFVQSDYLSAVDGTFDLIVSNPPYVRTADIGSLATEVRDHEPKAALDGGADGLGAYRALCAESPRHLEPGGGLIVEVGYDQADDVAQMMETAGLDVRRPFTRDLADIPRVVEGRKRGR